MWSANLAVATALLAVNAYAFVLMGADKRRAKRNMWRISERKLLTVSLCFGALGAFMGMRLFRHKTQHMRFRIGIPVMLILQLLIIGMLIIKQIS